MQITLAFWTVASLTSAPFFDTAGRLQRTGAPAADVVARYVPVYKGELCVSPCTAKAERGRDCEPVLLSAEAASPFTAHEDCITQWIGTAKEGPLAAHGGEGSTPGFWLLELSHLETAPDLGGKWAPLRASRGPGGGEAAILGGSDVRLTSDDDVALLTTARGLALWHRSIPHCSACGGKTKPFRNGRNRKCEDCGTRYRPQLDPSVIVLVTRGDQCLLGRKKEWPAGRYSTLAGFVEFGETFEECVLREMMEEAGVQCDRTSLRFVGSQPWLFPRSLMVGFLVETKDEVLHVDEDELEDAQWFEREFVRGALARQGDLDKPAEPGAFHVPSSISLARTIIERWLED